MGSKFAQSVANIFMPQWEQQVIYADKPKELLMYKRYIDDVLILWEREEKKLKRVYRKA